MKILFPVEVFYPSQAGGAANSVYWLAKAIAARGFAPTIVASNKGLAPDVPVNRWQQTSAGRVIHVRTASLSVPIGQTLRSLTHVRAADIVHVQSVFYPTAMITAFAARAAGKKLIWSVRGELDPFTLANHSSGRKARVLWAVRNGIGTYPLFHSTCDEETGYIRDVFGPSARVVQISNFIEAPALVNRSPGKYLLFIGRINPKKGIENLLTGLAMTPEFLQSGHVLKIAGTGSARYRQELERLVASLKLQAHVEFVGQIEGPAKQQLLADAFWTFMPSHTENFGIVVLESLAQQTPVVASKGSPWRALEDGNVGFWTGNTPEELSAVVKRIFAMDPQQYAAMRARSRTFVEARFDVNKNIDRWIDAYRSV